MSASTHEQPFERQRFHDALDSPAQTSHAGILLEILLAQDGSTTRLCETIAKGSVALQVVEQRIVHALPAQLSGALTGVSFIERITYLAAHGQVMMDNLSYIALDRLPVDVRRDLENAVMPIGHLLSRLWVRRALLDAAPTSTLYDRLWGAVGMPDPEASRVYCICTPEGPLMLITETYRRGMLMRQGMSVSTGVPTTSLNP